MKAFRNLFKRGKGERAEHQHPPSDGEVEVLHWNKASKDKLAAKKPVKVKSFPLSEPSSVKLAGTVPVEVKSLHLSEPSSVKLAGTVPVEEKFGFLVKSKGGLQSKSEGWEPASTDFGISKGQDLKKDFSTQSFEHRPGKLKVPKIFRPYDFQETVSLTDTDKLYLAMKEAGWQSSFSYFYFILDIDSLDALKHYNEDWLIPKGVMDLDQFREIQNQTDKMESLNFEEIAKKHEQNSFAQTCESKGIPVIDMPDVQVQELIASGPCAGFVCTALWTRPSGVTERICLRFSGPDQRMKFLHEAEMAQHLQHDNILKVHGIIIPSQFAHSLGMVVELAKYGNLLEASPHYNVERLCHYTAQAATALEYLEKKKVIHKSLLFNNFLLVSKHELKLAGIGVSDFESVLQRNQPSLKEINLQKDAVAGFSKVFRGAFLSYELPSTFPRERMAVTEVNELVTGLLCPDQIAELFERCTQENLTMRPSFSEIRQLLSEYLRSLKVRVVSDFTSDSNGDLSGKVGDVITLISKDRSREDKNLWFGQKENGEIGFFRREHVEEVTDDTSAVPAEIRARGTQAELAFQKALRNGKVRIYRGRIMLIGQDRAGKTSLKKSLLGLPFDLEEQSTVGVEVDPSTCQVDVDQVRNWQRTCEKKLDVSEFVDDIAKIVAGELNRGVTTVEDSGEMLLKDTESTPEKVEQEKEEVNIPTQGEPIHPSTAGTAEKTTNQNGADLVGGDTPTNRTEIANVYDITIDPAVTLTDDVTERIIQYLQSLKLEDDIKPKETILTLWDFAGQHLYYASHSVFFSPRAVYILVYNLSKELNAIAEPVVRQGTNDIRLENPNNETNLDSLLSWLISVHNIRSTSFGDDSEMFSREGNLPYLRPPVFIVGTHADQPFEDTKKMEADVKKNITGKTYEKHVIRPFFCVNNSCGLTDDGVSALQDKVMEILRQEPYMGEEIPIRWFNFEEVVHALVAKKTYHVNLNQLMVVIKQVCFIEDEDELIAMLNFYHDLGVIVKHGSTVVLQAQWLIDLFKKLITVKPFDEVNPMYSQRWRQLESSGILSMELVDHVLGEMIQHGLNKQDVLEMMELYGLIAKFLPSGSASGMQYFVPAQLTASPAALWEIKESASDPCPLYFHFLDGFVPHGLFTQVVSRCIRWCAKHSPQRAPNLYHNGARFFIGRKPVCDLILICKKRFIKVVFKRRKPHCDIFKDQDQSADIACHVRRFLEETLQELSRELSWLRHLRYEVCVACPCCLRSDKKCITHAVMSCTHDDCLHLIQVLPEEPLICEKNFDVETLSVCGFEKWFVKQCNENEDKKPFDPSEPVQVVDQTLKSGTPSRDDLLLIARDVGSLWKNLGLALGLEDPELEQIEEDKRDLFEKSYSMLRTWTQAFGSEATYCSLAKAFHHSIVQRPDLTAKYCGLT